MRFALTCCSILFIFFSSCSVQSHNWKSNDLPGHLQASFDYFNGKEEYTVQAGKDHLLFIDYAIAATAGTITLSVKHTRQVLWEKQFNAQSDTAGFYITVPEAGQYKITMKGDKAAGRYEVKYSITEPKQVQVKTNRNIELYGLMMQIDDGGDIIGRKDSAIIGERKATWQQWYAMTVRNYLQYRQFDTSRVMRIYRKMEADGSFYDFFVGFFLQVKEAPFAGIDSFTDKRAIMSFSPKGDTAEARQKATDFLTAFNAFYYTVDFDQYLAKNKTYYDITRASVIKNIPGKSFLPVMEHYYRQEFNQYYLVPGLNILTGMGFGTMNRNTKTIYNTFGPFSFQSLDSAHPDMAFDYPEKIRALAVHEFGHSFVNPAIDKLPQAVIRETEYLYAPIKDKMSKLAYTNWSMCLHEIFVRAGEVIIAEKIGDSARAIHSIKENVQSGFIYLPFIVEELKAWDKRYSSTERFDDAVLQTLQKLKARFPR